MHGERRIVFHAKKRPVTPPLAIARGLLASSKSTQLTGDNGRPARQVGTAARRGTVTQARFRHFSQAGSASRSRCATVTTFGRPAFDRP